MKKRTLFFMILLPVFSFSQVSETFNDGNFTENPKWSGSISNFKVNPDFQLQSNVAVSSTSSIFTPSEAFNDASWECWVKIDYTTSSSNYISIYIISDKTEILNGCNAYYVQVGGTNDDVSLYAQQGNKKTKLIDGSDKRTDGKPVELRIKVTRDTLGNFKLFSKLPDETGYYLEGTVKNTLILKSSYFGLLFSNTTTTGTAYYFDEIVVTGEKAADFEAPVLNSLSLELPNKIVLSFSEAVKYTSTGFFVDKNINKPFSITPTNDNTTLELLFENDFQTGELYTLEITNLTDIAGNILTMSKTFGIAENIEEGNIIFNEVMFENHENSLEYIELYNTSEKLLDISGLVLTTRKTDGSLNTGNKIPFQTLLGPKSYAAFCSNNEIVSNFHNSSTEKDIYSMEWTDLNNESATVLITDATKVFIYDEFTYSSKWHHSLIKNTKGVALERINPELPSQNSLSWHSAASEVNYGTPGYKNSQYREINTSNSNSKIVWLEPEAFSPDNDGVDDVCLIKYKTNDTGYVANAIILNSTGIKVRTIASNILLSSNGFLIWDGRTERGINANAGIYILYFELFNPEKGDRKQIKLPIVVSVR